MNLCSTANFPTPYKEEIEFKSVFHWAKVNAYPIYQNYRNRICTFYKSQIPNYKFVDNSDIKCINWDLTKLEASAEPFQNLSFQQ